MRLSRNITNGVYGDDVLMIQNKLYELGYYNHISNSIFDNNTISALNMFQRDNNLEVVDYISLKTLRKLFSNNIQKKDNIIREIKTNLNFSILNMEIESSLYFKANIKKSKIKLHFYNTSNTNSKNALYVKNKILSQVIIGDNILYRYDIMNSPSEKDVDTLHIDILGFDELSKDIMGDYIDNMLNKYVGEVISYNKKYYKVPNTEVIDNIKSYIKYIQGRLNIDKSDINLGLLNNYENILEYVKLL